MEWGEEIYHLHFGTLCYGSDSLLNLCVPVACAALETVVAVENRCHLADEYACFRVHGEERVDESMVVGDEFFFPVGPVARVGVVQSEMNHYPVRLEVKSLTEFLRVDVGAVALVEQRSARMSEVPDLETVAQHLLQTYGVCCVFTVFQSIAIGDAVADAGHSYCLWSFCLAFPFC